MKKKFFNSDIRNKVIAGLYVAIVLAICPLIIPTIISLVEKTTFKQSFNELYIWFRSHFFISIGSFIVIIILFIIICRNYLTENPIKWNFEGLLGMTGIGKDGLYDWDVRSFQAIGKNRLYRPILNIDGYVEIHRDNSRFQLKLNKNGQLGNLDELISLPPKQKIEVTAFFGTNINDYASFKGESIDNFLLKYSPFTFIVFINGKEHHYSFSKKEISKYIEKITSSVIQTQKPLKQTGPIFRKN